MPTITTKFYTKMKTSTASILSNENQNAGILPNRGYRQPFIELYNEDCQKGIKRIPDNSVQCVLTDPPYLYLKGQKLEREFDERLFFSECMRILKPSGFIVLFGRGTSFYRWNVLLDELGFSFKEEIIWNKNYTSSPVHTVNRVHETVSIHTKKTGVLNKIKIPYEESRTIEDFEKVIADVNRLKTILNNEESFNHVLNYLNGNRSDLENKRSTNYATSCQTKALGSQTVSPMIAIKEGMKIKSIISEKRDHYNTIHPTQKPESLLKRLLALTTKKGDLVVDGFSGSCSTGIACANMEINFIGFEIDKEYYDLSVERLKTNVVQLGMF